MKRQEIISFVFFVFMNKLKLVCDRKVLMYQSFAIPAKCDNGVWFYFNNIPAKAKDLFWYGNIGTNKHILERISNER